MLLIFLLHVVIAARPVVKTFSYRARPTVNTIVSSSTTTTTRGRPAASTATPFASTLRGKVLYGYQAWFSSPSQYSHWSFSNGPATNATSQFDFFPDTTQYPDECLFESGFHFANGSSAMLYNAACEGVIATHFRWMNDAGIDGLIVQRFLVNRGYQSFTTILGLVRKYSEMYGKVFMVEYDLSGLSTSDVDNLSSIVQEDYTNVIQPLTKSPAYQRENGKPVFMIFGEGIRTNVSPEQCQSLNTQIKNYGMHLVLAPNWPWYNAYKAGTTDPYAPAYNQADTISPWAVGSYSGGADYASQHTNRKAAQDPILAANKQTYAPVIWPGFSWHNLMHNGNTPPVEYPYDQNPRYAGQFLQQQITTVLNDNSTYFVFIAMFDEVNEGTACAPTLNKNEIVDGTFVGDDASGSMFYLNAGGALSRQLKARMA